MLPYKAVWEDFVITRDHLILMRFRIFHHNPFLVKPVYSGEYGMTHKISPVCKSIPVRSKLPPFSASTEAIFESTTS